MNRRAKLLSAIGKHESLSWPQRFEHLEAWAKRRGLPLAGFAVKPELYPDIVRHFGGQYALAPFAAVFWHGFPVYQSHVPNGKEILLIMRAP